MLRWATVSEQSRPKSGGGCCAHFRGEELGPHLTECRLGPRSTSVPSGILIHPTVWPQHTNVTDRQTNRPKIGKIATFSSKIKSRRAHRTATMKTTTIAVDFLADTNSFIFGITCGGESCKQWDHTARRKVEGSENDSPKAPE